SATPVAALAGLRRTPDFRPDPGAEVGIRAAAPIEVSAPPPTRIRASTEPRARLNPPAANALTRIRGIIRIAVAFGPVVNDTVRPSFSYRMPCAAPEKDCAHRRAPDWP